MKFDVEPRAPYDFDRSLSVFKRWGDESILDFYSPGLYRRVVPTSKGNLLLQFDSVGTVDEPLVSVHSLSAAHGVGTAEVKGIAEHVLNASLDLAPVLALMHNDPVLRTHVETFRGVRPPLLPSLFEALVVAIIEQQIALPVAIRLKARMVERYGEVFDHAASRYYAFPSPHVLSQASIDDVRALGISRRKAEYVTGLAELVERGQLDLEASAALTDDELVARLTSVRGVGRWTAEYAAIRGLGRTSFLLADDLGVRRAVSKRYFHGDDPSSEQIRALLDHWGEHKGLLAFYLLSLEHLGVSD